MTQRFQLLLSVYEVSHTSVYEVSAQQLPIRAEFMGGQSRNRPVTSLGHRAGTRWLPSPEPRRRRPPIYKT